jgi:hypothetical protein
MVCNIHPMQIHENLHDGDVLAMAVARRPSWPTSCSVAGAENDINHAISEFVGPPK